MKTKTKSKKAVKTVAKSENIEKGSWQHSMPVSIPERGLYNRYKIEKVENEESGPSSINPIYFVLRLDNRGDDLTWVKCCRKAVKRLIKELRERDHLLKLADDLEDLLKDIKKGIQ